MRNFRATCLLLVICFMPFLACDQKDDLAPIFKNIIVNNLDETSLIAVAAGNDLTVQGEFVDDVALKSYVVNISHDDNIAGGNVFSFESEYDLSGTSDTKQASIGIPAVTPAGPYTLELYVIDANGSSSGSATFDLAVTRTTMADIGISSPTEGASFSQGQTIPLSGTVTDETDLVSITIVVEPLQMEGGLVAASSFIFKETILLGGSEDKTWEFADLSTLGKEIQIPSNIPASGEYGIIIKAEDSEENIAVSLTKVWINK